MGGNYKNFHHIFVALWGNYKVLGQNIHPWHCPVVQYILGSSSHVLQINNKDNINSYINSVFIDFDSVQNQNS